MKTCTTCKTAKPFEDFYKRKTSKDGHRGQCKQCEKAYSQSEAGRASTMKTNNKASTKARKLAWKKTPKGREAKARYEKSPAGKAKFRRYFASERGQQTWKAYYEANSDGYKARASAFHAENYTPSPEWEIKKHQPHRMYLIRFTQGNRTYIKVGLTWRTIEERFARDVATIRMNTLEILDVITFKDFETCNIAESIIHDATLDSHVTPVIAFGGSVKECRLLEATEQILSMFESARAAMDN